MIEGVVISNLEIIQDERGSVMHMMRADDPVFKGFGEIYFSSTYPGVVKAWHCHRQMTLNYAAIHGAIKLVLFDDRPGSATFGSVQEIYLSRENYKLVTVPPNVWNGFKSIGEEMAILANCATIPHSPEEIVRKPADSQEIPYDWHLVQR